jgi:hypothetical protein
MGSEKDLNRRLHRLLRTQELTVGTEQTLREVADGGDVPFVAKALCLPDVDVDPKIPSFKEIDRNLIVDRDDLAAFEMTWRRLFAKRHQTISAKERTIFLNSFAKDISPKAIKQFISEPLKIDLSLICPSATIRSPRGFKERISRTFELWQPFKP